METNQVCILHSEVGVPTHLLTSEQLKLIKSALTISNPLFEQRTKLRIIPWGIPKSLEYWKETTPGILTIPVGIFPKIIKKWNLPYQDAREEGQKLKITFSGVLRDYQAAAVDRMLQGTIGTVQATTGSGKTVIAIAYIAQRARSTLILVDTIELANQWIDRIKTFTNVKEVGMIGNGVYDIKPITVALLQSMHRMDDTKLQNLSKDFGVVICDEVHCVAANTYYNVMSKLPCKYKHGLSATPKREDGLTSVIFWAAGPIIYKIEEDALQSHLVFPKYEKIETKYSYPLFSAQDYAIMLSDLSVDDERNELIKETWEANAVKNKPLYYVLGCYKF